MPGDDFYMEAFWNLGTERQLGMSMGPIPWTAMRKYAEFYGLEEDMVEPFIRIIRAMDGAYLERAKDKMENS